MFWFVLSLFFFVNLDSLGFFWLFETETLLRNLPSSSLLSFLLLEASDFQHPNLFLVQWKNHPCFLMKQTAPSLLLHAIFRGKNISQSYSFGWEHHFTEQQLQCKEHTDWQSLIFIYLLHSIDWRSQILRRTNLFSFSCWLFINVLSLALLESWYVRSWKRKLFATEGNSNQEYTNHNKYTLTYELLLYVHITIAVSMYRS